MSNEHVKKFLRETITELVKKCDDVDLLDLIVLLLQRKDK